VHNWSHGRTECENEDCFDDAGDIYLLTYLLTSESRVLEQLTGSELVKKFPAFYGSRKFITAFTSARDGGDTVVITTNYCSPY
jgi:hypothetical protein